MHPNDIDIFDMNQIQEHFNAFTESVEEQFELAARSLQDAFRDNPWVPESMRPRSLPPPRFQDPVRCSTGYFEATRYWISEHRAITAAVVAFLGTGAYIVWRRRRLDRAKRRAKRTKQGAKTEVVVLAGSPYSPLTKSLSTDLERRGFIVYIPTGSLSEEQAIQSEAGTDIKALSLDLASTESTQSAIKKLEDLLTLPRNAGPSSSSYKLHLAAMIFLPPPTYPTGALANIDSVEWSDILNNHLLAPFTSTHAFLPLLSSQTSNLVFLTSSIVPSLVTPSHAPESVVAGALEKYISTLRQEFPSINVVQMKLGLFNYGNLADERKQLVLSDATTPKTPLDLPRKSGAGSPLRLLHNNVFDAIVRGRGKNGTIFVGKGSRLYDFVGKWMPRNFVNQLVSMAKGKEPVLAKKESAESLGESSDWENLH